MAKLSIKKINQFKNELNLTVEEIANNTDLTIKQVELLLSDKKHHITLNQGVKLATLFKCSLPDLLEFTEGEEISDYYYMQKPDDIKLLSKKYKAV